MQCFVKVRTSKTQHLNIKKTIQKHTKKTSKNIAKTMPKIDRNGKPKEYSKMTSKIVPKPLIFEPGARGAHRKMSKTAQKDCFLRMQILSKKMNEKITKNRPPRITTYGKTKINPVHPSLRLPPPEPVGCNATKRRTGAFRN